MHDEDKLKRVTIGGLKISGLSRKEFAELMIDDWKLQCANSYQLLPKISYSANGQIVAVVNRSSLLRDLYNAADYIDADGMWMVFASRFLTKKPLPERVATTDFFHDAALAASSSGMSFYILGSTPDNNVKAFHEIQQLYPSLKLVGSHHGYFVPDEEHKIISAIKSSKPDVLWVGMGCPRQEMFVHKYRGELKGITWIKTCGGLLEHILEIQPRAPLWMQRAGFEWLYRLSHEPRRLFLRYLITNPIAFWFLLTRTKNNI